MSKSTLKLALDDILLEISWAQISKNHFGKSRSWLNHKINGIDSNGNKAEISDDEKHELKTALYELSDRIVKCANDI